MDEDAGPLGQNLDEYLYERIEMVNDVDDLVAILNGLMELVAVDREYAQTSRALLSGTVKTVQEWSGGHFELDPQGPRAPDAQRLRFIARVLISSLALHDGAQ